MATFNGEKYLVEQIESILNQTYKNWELIIHDDNSSDKTLDILMDYNRKYPEKVRILNDTFKAGGAKENFSYLLENITDDFDYLMFADQDDVWLENKIEVTLRKMKEVEKLNPQKPILIHTDLKIVDESLNIISDSMIHYQKLDINNGNSLLKISLENVVTGCTMMINRYLKKLIYNIPKEAIMHDWWLAIITLKYGGKISFINQSLILYRQHQSNTVGSVKVDIIYYMKKISTFANSLNRFIAVIKQLRRAEIHTNLFYLVIIKFIMIFKRIVI